MVAKGKEAMKCCLLGKILSKKLVNKRALKEAINNLWKLEDGLTVQEAGRDL